MDRAKVERTAVRIAVLVSVFVSIHLSWTRERNYRHIIYMYEDMRDGIKVDTSFIHDMVGEPNEDYYYDMPRYPHFWDERKAR